MTHNEELEQTIGHSLDLTCHVEAYPPPTITWIHDGVQLSSNKYFSVDNGYSSSHDFTETSVRIKTLTKRLTGIYYCRAQNKLGSSERSIKVKESTKPNCVVGHCEGYTSQANTICTRSMLSLFTFVLILWRWRDNDS